MKITQLDRQNLKLLRSEIDVALKSLGDKYGIAFQAGNASFTYNNATFKLECNTIGVGGEVIDKDMAEFKSYGSMYGLKDTDLGRLINYNGNIYTVKGLRSSSKKFPIIAKRQDGKMFKLPLSAVKPSSLTPVGNLV